MKSKLSILILLLFAFNPASKAQKVRFMPQWYPQAQFAGYYVAMEKGFYAEEGLDVEIRHLSNTSSYSSFDFFKKGEVDIISMQLMPAMVQKGNGLDIVNVLQTSQNSALMCVSHRPIKSFSDLEGKKVGRWRSGFAEIAEAFCQNTNTTVDWVFSLQANNLFLSNAVDATLVYSYSEYLGLLFSLGEIPAENTVRFAEFSYNFPEDGLYVSGSYLRNNKETVDKFVRSSIKGWQYASEHQEEAVDIVMNFIKGSNVVTSRQMQKMMLEEIIRLQRNPLTGEIDFAFVNEDLFNIIADDMSMLGYFKGRLNYNDFKYEGK